MKFVLDGDQLDFAGALDSLLANADTVAVARAWADGDHEPGLKLWGRLAEMGVTSLADEPVFLVLAFERLGYHAVPGPWVESVAYLGRADGIATVALPPHVPYALDADVADEVYAGSARAAEVGDPVGSVDRARRLFRVTGEGATDEAAFDRAVLATSAQLLGAGERILTDSVTYVKQRRQFGREIGSYQAIKHQLADVRIALDFARPLVLGAALGEVPVSAAKIACADAAYRSSRTGLQVHGAIGYTQEFDLSIWLTKVRALVTAWGTPAYHRQQVLEGLV
ncbi:acyl-CoA dehydrogenase family protein [Nocardioides sp. SR21]|uniref:acyl-CoA dehydrogenase family protein n=1 Tax=Nocardioides sp. SR21 TaxID=2919501 RepID=UPI001FA98AA2|nr:acyl-CoA dehydrogenase family protein [Nocardioides sp. SR21]